MGTVGVGLFPRLISWILLPVLQLTAHSHDSENAERSVEFLPVCMTTLATARFSDNILIQT